MLLESVKQQANALAENNQATDMSTAQKGSTYLLPEGVALARFVEYVETGMHTQEYQGKAKDPRRMFRVGFALFGEGYQKEDGTPRTISSFSMALMNNERARSFKLFQLMNWKGDKKNFAQMLGEPFLVNIKHVKTSNGEMRARLDLEGIAPPVEPLSKRPYPVPEAPSDVYRVLLWDAPTREQWESIRIGKEGDGKNFLQDECLAALDFANSKLDQLLRAQGSAPLPPLNTATDPMAYQADDDIPF